MSLKKMQPASTKQKWAELNKGKLLWHIIDKSDFKFDDEWNFNGVEATLKIVDSEGDLQPLLYTKFYNAVLPTISETLAYLPVVTDEANWESDYTLPIEVSIKEMELFVAYDLSMSLKLNKDLTSLLEKYSDALPLRELAKGMLESDLPFLMNHALKKV